MIEKIHMVLIADCEQDEIRRILDNITDFTINKPHEDIFDLSENKSQTKKIFTLMLLDNELHFPRDLLSLIATIFAKERIYTCIQEAGNPREQTANELELKRIREQLAQHLICTLNLSRQLIEMLENQYYQDT